MNQKSLIKIAKSIPVELKVDSNISKLWFLLPKIKKQSFQPYIYKHTSNGIEHYGVNFRTHSTIFDLRVQTKNITKHMQLKN